MHGMMTARRKVNLSPSWWRQRYFTSSPCESGYPEMVIAGRRVFVKRDDLVYLHGLNGNKGRKLYHLAKKIPFPKVVLSYGGARSNAMLAMARLISSHPNSEFIYFIKNGLKSSHVGNFAEAVSLGMQHFEVSKTHYDIIHAESMVSAFTTTQQVPRAIIAALSPYYTPPDGDWSSVYLVPQGGFMPQAEEGLALLARDLYDFMFSQSAHRGSVWKVVVESGTGTTAAYLARTLDAIGQQTRLAQTGRESSASAIMDIQVVAVSVVMPPGDLMTAMTRLLSGNGQDIVPTCLTVLPYPQALLDKSKGKRRVFGRPVEEHRELWSLLQASAGFDFDLLYAPLAWEQLIHSPQWGGPTAVPGRISPAGSDAGHRSAGGGGRGRGEGPVVTNASNCNGTSNWRSDNGGSCDNSRCGNSSGYVSSGRSSDRGSSSSCSSSSSSSSSSSDSGWWGPEVNIIYIHCGGIEGNATQLPRYRRLQTGRC